MIYPTDSYINRQRASKIKLLVSDNDGVFTSGSIYVFRDNEEDLQRFNVLDGAVFATLQQHGIQIAVISGRNSVATHNRFTKLKADYLHLGIENKIIVLSEIVRSLNLEWSEVAYIGDDLIDLECINTVGLSFAPDNAIDIIKKQVSYVCNKSGGNGVFREVADYILQAQQQ